MLVDARFEIFDDGIPDSQSADLCFLFDDIAACSICPMVSTWNQASRTGQSTWHNGSGGPSIDHERHGYIIDQDRTPEMALAVRF